MCRRKTCRSSALKYFWVNCGSVRISQQLFWSNSALMDETIRFCRNRVRTGSMSTP